MILCEHVNSTNHVAAHFALFEYLTAKLDNDCVGSLAKMRINDPVRISLDI